MKVITLIQPWATLIALGEKKFETRSWATKYRGELGIHAGKKIDKAACRQEPIRSVLAKHGYDETKLPTGVILAISQLEHCRSILRPDGEDGYVRLDAYFEKNGDAYSNAIAWLGPLPNEYYFGDYSSGRYAWQLSDVKPLDVPIPAKGQLGLWNYNE